MLLALGESAADYPMQGRMLSESPSQIWSACKTVNIGDWHITKVYTLRWVQYLAKFLHIPTITRTRILDLGAADQLCPELACNACVKTW